MKKKFVKKSLAWLLAAVMIIGFMPAGVFAEGEETGGDSSETKGPVHAKVCADNGDGTYTLALSVTGDCSQETEVTPTNVIVIMDVSGSMDNDTGNSEITYEVANSGRGTRYGLIENQYVELIQWGGTYYYVSGDNWYDWTAYTGDRYRRIVHTETRLKAAQKAVNDLAKELLSLNTESDPDAFELALVSFSTKAEIELEEPTTDYNTFKDAVDGLSANGGTNWEDALKKANEVNFDDENQLFVIFVSDGNPTFRETQAGHNDYNRQFGVYGSGYEQNENVTWCYNEAIDDAKALVDNGATLYTIGAYGNVSRMQDLTQYSYGEDTTENHYYSAEDTDKLKAALEEILEKIKTAGIAEVSMEDGTTSNVSVSTDSESAKLHLLSIDESSFKYYRAGGLNEDGNEKYDSDENTITIKTETGTENVNLGVEWTSDPTPPAATVDANGTVKWDLSELDVLENEVTYTVTFVCSPGEDALDMIAALKNGEAYEKVVPEAARLYLDNKGNLKTNTTATLNYVDTRTGEEGPVKFDNPDPVPTEAEEIVIEKQWFGEYEGEETSEKVLMDVVRDSNVVDTITLEYDASNKKHVGSRFIAAGLLTKDKSNNVHLLVAGHDYELRERMQEEGDLYHWELQAGVMHPMLINGKMTMLVKVEDAAEKAGITGVTATKTDGTYYLIGADYYKVVSSDTENLNVLKAENYRRSNLNLKKVVEGESANPNAKFSFDLKLEAPGNASASDKEFWFSIMDTKNTASPDDDVMITNATVKNATPQTGASAGYYVVESGKTATVELKAGWNLRFTNILTGTQYTFEEKNLAEGFTLKENGITVTPAEEKEADKATIQDKVISGKVIQANQEYQVVYTNKYELGALKITKNVSGAPMPNTATFTIRGPNNYSKSVTFNDFVDGVYTLYDLADGEYTVTETNAEVSGYELATTYSPERGKVTVQDHNLAEVTVTNTYTKETTPPSPPSPPTPPTPIDPEPVPLDLVTDHIAYIEGYPDGTVQPEGNITRAEVATMIYRLLTEDRRMEIFTSEGNYSDVEAANWFNKAVASMTVGEYVNGYPDGSFLPNQKITRAEFVTIVVRFLEGMRDAENPFSDIDDHWAKDYILSAVNAGWINGYPDGTFQPDKPITRAEAMTIMNTILHRGVNEESELLEPVMFPDNNDPSKWYYYEVIEATNNHEATEERPSEQWTANECEYYYDIEKYERPEV